MTRFVKGTAVVAVTFATFWAMRYLLDITVSWPVRGKAALSWAVAAILSTGVYRVLYGKWPHPSDR